MNRKKRILWISEATILNTGFSTLSHEILTRLNKTNKYEIAEFGSYVHEDDPRGFNIPWKFYGAIPSQRDEYWHNRYNQSIYGQFGATLFERVCLDFLPDCCIDTRDFWMSSEWTERSPFRQYFKYLIGPTVDGSPQKIEWIDGYKQADLVLTYSNYGKRILEEESSDKINVFDVFAPGVNHEIFKPLNKDLLRTQFGISKNANIIMTVMRNQKRKLYPELISMFVELLKQYIEEEKYDLYKNTYLLIHTSHPDVGYDISRLILESGVGNKILVSYVCQNCHKNYIDFFQSELTACRYCGNMSCHMPNTANGINREELSKLYNLADLYIQYSICLGKNEEVLLKRGWTPIKDVKIGDYAYTHNNRYMPVVKTFINPSSNNVKEISIHSDFEKLIITDNHPVYALSSYKLNTGFKKDRKKTAREYIGDLIRNNKDIPNPEFIEVSKLNEGDLIAFPINDSIEDIEKIDLSEFATDKCIIFDNHIELLGHNYPRFINVDEDFCKLMGIFAANGSWGKDNSDNKITLNYDHKNTIEFLKLYIPKILNKSPFIREYNDRRAIDISMCSVIHRNFFRKYFGKFITKSLPHWVDKLPLNKQKKILEGLFCCDGCWQVDTNTSIYCSISKSLVGSIKNLLRRNRINYNVRLIIKKCNDNKIRQKQYILEVPCNIGKGEFIVKRTSTANIYIDRFHFVKIKKIINSNYNENVFNFEVEEDNSYVTRIGIVHNCEGFGMPIAEAKACEIPACGLDHTAISEQVNAPGCFPIKNGRSFYESVLETEQIRFLPDNKDAIKKIKHFFSLPKEVRIKMGQDARKHAIETASFDRSAKIWEKAVDSIDIFDENKTWLNPNPRLAPNNLNFRKSSTFSEFVDLCIINILGDQKLLNSCWRNEVIKSLNCGYIINRQGRENFDVNKCISLMTNIAQNQNNWEFARINKFFPDNKKRVKWEMV